MKRMLTTNVLCILTIGSWASVLDVDTLNTDTTAIIIPSNELIVIPDREQDLDVDTQNADTTTIIIPEPGPIVNLDRDRYPFIEDGKKWETVLLDEGGQPTAFYEYYFSRETIVKNQLCRMLVRSQVENRTPLDTLEIGACYEKDGRVYYIGNAETDQWQLLYDFNASSNDEITLEDKSYTICNKEKGLLDGFKGDCIQLQLSASSRNDIITWMDGVGATSSPLCNLVNSTESQQEILLSCSFIQTGEVLYYNPILDDNQQYSQDGPLNAKRHSIDFTHVIKIQPQRRIIGSQAMTLTCECSSRELLVKFPFLKGIYSVALKNAAGTTLYDNKVQTNSIVAISRDLSEIPDGVYALTVENDEELYTATFTLPFDETAIHDAQLINHQSSNHQYFDLSGRRLANPPARGLYIREGKVTIGSRK